MSRSPGGPELETPPASPPISEASSPNQFRELHSGPPLLRRASTRGGAQNRETERVKTMFIVFLRTFCGMEEDHKPKAMPLEIVPALRRPRPGTAPWLLEPPRFTGASLR